MFDESKNIKDTTYTITEVSNFIFHYPYMGMIKGGTEIITYDFTKSIYGYLRLNSPIISVSSTEWIQRLETDHNSESLISAISYITLIDVGPYFVFGVIESKDLFEFKFKFCKRFIDKNLIVTDKLLTFYDPIPWRWDDSRNEDPGLILHTLNYLQQINLVKYNSKVVQQGRYKPEDIRHLNGTGLLFGKRGEKCISHFPIPIKIDEKFSGNVVYSSIDYIRSIDYNFEGETPYIYVWDNDEYIKKFEMVKKDSTTLKLVYDFYTFPGFSGKEIYRINDGMIFVKTLGVKLQEKNFHLKSSKESFDTFQPNLGMEEDTIDEIFPLVSQDVLLFWGKAKSRSLVFKPWYGLIIPSYWSPLFRLLPWELSQYLVNEFFFYPKSINSEFIVYQLNRDDIDCVEFAFYKPNGKYESSIHLKIRGIEDYENVLISVSPNGRFIFYVEENEEMSEEDDKDHNTSRRISTINQKVKYIGRVWEIIGLRPKHDSRLLK